MLTPALTLTAGRMVALIFTFLQVLLVGHLPTGVTGVFWPHLGIMTALAVAIDLGTGQALLRLCAGGEEEKGEMGPEARCLIRAAFRFRLHLAWPAMAAHLLLVVAMGDQRGDPLLPVALLLLPAHALGVCQTPFLLRSRPLPLVLTRLGGAAATLAGTAILFVSGVARAGPYLLVHAAGTTLAQVLLWRASGLALRGPRAALGPLLPESVLLGAGSFLRMLYYHGDTLLVRLLAGKGAAEIYGTVYRVFGLATLLPNSLGDLLLGPLTRQHRRIHGPKDIRLGSLSRRLVLVALTPLVAGFILAEPLLTSLWSDKYSGSGDLLRILLVAALLVHPASIQITAALAAGRLRPILVLSAAGLVLTTLLCLVLVPPGWGFGALGAAWATVGTEAFILIGVLDINRRGRRTRHREKAHRDRAQKSDTLAP